MQQNQEKREAKLTAKTPKDSPTVFVEWTGAEGSKYAEGTRDVLNRSEAEVLQGRGLVNILED